MIEKIKPEEIEKRSFEIIREELVKRGIQLPEKEESVIMRCIHTSADFDYVDLLHFSPDAFDLALQAIVRGEHIITDTQMAFSGINKKRLEQFGGKAHCFMSDEEVAREAKARGITRAMVSMERAADIGGRPIIAIGNAPTALIHVCDLIQKKQIHPSLVIGAPVGFVNVIASKEYLEQQSIPHIVVRGNKGGSNIAACICNALLYAAVR